MTPEQEKEQEEAKEGFRVGGACEEERCQEDEKEGHKNGCRQRSGCDCYECGCRRDSERNSWPEAASR